MGDPTSIRISSIFGFFTLLCVLAAPSQAQTALEEIVVTAQKREQNIQDVPISITRMSGQWLESKFAGGGDVLELASTVPGLHVESSNGRLSPRFYMRGLGNADLPQPHRNRCPSCLTKCRWRRRLSNHFPSSTWTILR